MTDGEGSGEGSGIVAEKFGGDILGERGEGLPDVLERIAGLDGKHLVVVSALRGTTDRLKEYLRTRDDSLVRDRVAGAYVAAASGAGLDPPAILKPLLKSLRVMGDAEILALGEVLSTDLVYAYLRKAGVDAERVSFLTTRGTELEAEADFPIRARQYREMDADPDLAASRERMGAVKELLDAHDVVVAPGFVALFRDGRAVTLGRGGSDTTLFVYAHGLGIRETVLWKAVPGIRSGNPEMVPSHRLVRHLTPLEGLNLTLFGGDIVNYKAMQIAYDNEIGIRVPFVKDPRICSVVGGEGDGADDSVKYVGGTRDAILLHMDHEEAKAKVERLIERNLGDFVHVYGPALDPTVAVLDSARYDEIADEEGWASAQRMDVAAVGIVGDGLGEMRGPLAEAARTLTDAGLVVHGTVAATRKRTRGGYMVFFVEREHFEKVVRLEHDVFIEERRGSRFSRVQHR